MLDWKMNLYFLSIFIISLSIICLILTPVCTTETKYLSLHTTLKYIHNAAVDSDS